MLHRLQVFRVMQDEVRLARGAERNGMAVGVAAGQHIFATRQRIKELLVEQIPHRALMHRAVGGHCGSCERFSGST